MATTYKPLRVSGEGRGFATTTAELGAFRLGIDEFGANAVFDTTIVFAPLDNATQTTHPLDNVGQGAYQVLDTLG